MKWLSAVALCLVVTYVAGQAYDDWIHTVYNRVGDSVTFNCTSPISEDAGHPRPVNGVDEWENATVQYWLAYLDRVNIGETIKEGNIAVSPDGWQLTVRNVTPEYHGIYHCVMTQPDDSYYLVKWGINMKGPYFIDLWEKYELNVIIGFSAMGGFLLLAAFILGVYHFRYIDPEEQDDLNEKKFAYSNDAYINGEYNEPKSGMYETSYYDDVPTLPQEKTGYYDDMKTPHDEYSLDQKAEAPSGNDPVVVSVAEVHSGSESSPVYVISGTSPVSSMPEPEEDTKF